mgnify:CR=1 FL=1
MTRRAEPLGRVPVELLDAQAADRPGDHELLDLLGALEDVVGLLKASDPAVGESVATAAIGIAYLGPHDLRRRLAGTPVPRGTPAIDIRLVLAATEARARPCR